MKKKRGINISIVHENDARDRLRLISDIAVALIITAAFWLMIYQALRLGKTGTGWLTGGLPVLADRFQDKLTELTLKIHMGIGGKDSVINNIFTPMMILLTAAVSYAAVRFRNPVLLIVLAAVGIAGAVTGIIPAGAASGSSLFGSQSGIWLVLYFAALALAAFYKAYKAGACSKHNRNATVLTAGTAIGAGVLAALLFVTGVGGLPGISEAREYAERYMHEKKYEKYSNPMPEGRVSEAGSFDPGDGTALDVSEAHWETTYLKGFVGEVYDGKSWKRRKDSTVADDADMFYWLHKNGFYGQTETGAAYNVSGTEAEGFVSVTNLRACRRYCYVPYGVYMQDESFLDKKDVGDLNIEVEDPANSTDYIFSVVENSVESSRGLQRSIRDKDEQQDKDIKAFLDKEETYRKTVRKRYLDVPDDVKKTIADCLGKQEKLSPADAMERILTFMNENVKYSEKTSRSGDSDFILNFLDETGKGYAIHYASAAVMMLRYYGIPARYVEGYIIPDTLYGDAPEMSSVTVPSKFSHAWAEYYLNGVGWMPFETVPKYQNSGKEGIDPLQTTGKKNKENKKRDKKKTENPMNRHGYIFKPNYQLIAAGFGLILLALIIIYIMRRRKLKRFLATFNGQDVNTAVKNAFAYSITMLKSAGIKMNNTLLREGLAAAGMSAAAKAQMEKCITINEEARYSGRTLGEDQRKAVLDFKNTCMGIYKEKRAGTGKIWDRLVRCIY